MATMTTVQALAATTGAPARLSTRTEVRRLFDARRSSLAPTRANSSLLITRCMAEDPLKEKTTPSASKFTPPPSNDPDDPPQKPKVSTNFSDLFAFSGPAPERINGRLAMIGFVAAIGVELAKGQDLFAQITEGGGVAWFAITTLVLSAASLFPLSKGVRPEAESDGIMTADAELWNGRLAMVGLVALAITEYVKGGTLV